MGGQFTIIARARRWKQGISTGFRPPRVQIFRTVCIEPATTIKCTLNCQITRTATLYRIPVRCGQPLLGWDEVGMGWDVIMGVKLGVTEDKLKMAGGGIK